MSAPSTIPNRPPEAYPPSVKQVGIHKQGKIAGFFARVGKAVKSETAKKIAEVALIVLALLVSAALMAAAPPFSIIPGSILLGATLFYVFARGHRCLERPF